MPDPDLERAARAYLQRFVASSGRLRRVLRRRLSRAERRGEEIDRPAMEQEVERVVERMTALGLVDDAAYARGVAESLRRRGLSRRALRAKLREKDLPAALVDVVLAEVAGDDELGAAWRFARRRRLGPFSRGDRAARRERDLAALGRAGFGYGVARAVVDGEPPGGVERSP